MLPCGAVVVQLFQNTFMADDGTEVLNRAPADESEVRAAIDFCLQGATMVAQSICPGEVNVLLCAQQWI